MPCGHRRSLICSRPIAASRSDDTQRVRTPEADARQIPRSGHLHARTGRDSVQAARGRGAHRHRRRSVRRRERRAGGVCSRPFGTAAPAVHRPGPTGEPRPAWRRQFVMTRRAATGSSQRSLATEHTTEPASRAANRILQGLAPTDRARLLAALQPVTFASGDVVCESGKSVDNIYFPTTAVVSSLYTTEDGATTEMFLVGNDGVVGVSSFLGGGMTPNQDVVVVAGDALRMKASALRDEFKLAGALQALLLRYTQALITQISQTAVCNRLHAVEQRLCRWLLMCRDRVERDELEMTQEFISNMLGGRRETVTVAAGRLQDAGLIRYSRGHITIVDRKGLEELVCECYLVVETAVTPQPAG